MLTEIKLIDELGLERYNEMMSKIVSLAPLGKTINILSLSNDKEELEDMLYIMSEMNENEDNELLFEIEYKRYSTGNWIEIVNHYLYEPRKSKYYYSNYDIVGKERSVSGSHRKWYPKIHDKYIGKLEKQKFRISKEFDFKYIELCKLPTYGELNQMEYEMKWIDKDDSSLTETQQSLHYTSVVISPRDKDDLQLFHTTYEEAQQLPFLVEDLIEYQDKSFILNYTRDKRGRCYCLNTFGNFQRFPIFKQLLVANKSNKTKIKQTIINTLLGSQLNDKISLSDRAKLGIKIRKQSDTKLLQADYPLIAYRLKHKLELDKMFIWLDATTSGLQIISSLFKDKKGMKLSNLISNQRLDFYKEISVTPTLKTLDRKVQKTIWIPIFYGSMSSHIDKGNNEVYCSQSEITEALLTKAPSVEIYRNLSRAIEYDQEQYTYSILNRTRTIHNIGSEQKDLDIFGRILTFHEQTKVSTNLISDLANAIHTLDSIAVEVYIMKFGHLSNHDAFTFTLSEYQQENVKGISKTITWFNRFLNHIYHKISITDILQEKYFFNDNGKLEEAIHKYIFTDDEDWCLGSYLTPYDPKLKISSRYSLT
jgi:hypothetical protein